MDLVRVREYCCSVVSVYLEKQLKRDVPQEDQNTCKDTVSRGKFTSPEIPVIVKTLTWEVSPTLDMVGGCPCSSRTNRSGAPE